MQIEIPDEMWKRALQEIEDTNYCFFCDNHPSYGHAPLCPVNQQVEPDADSKDDAG